jgi:nitroreductase
MTDDAPFDLAQTDLLLSTTRAVRRRLDLERPVGTEVLLDCLRLATQAPSGSNSQAWHFVVVTDPALRSGLADLYRRGGEAYLAATTATDEQSRRVRGSAEYLVDVIDRVPVLVIPCLRGRVRKIEHAAGFFGSIHPAIWSFQLALRSRGLGSVWTTFHLAHEQEAAELLGIPDGVTQAAMLPVAYTLGTDFRPAARRPVEEVTSINGWTPLST